MREGHIVIICHGVCSMVNKKLWSEIQLDALTTYFLLGFEPATHHTRVMYFNH